MALIQGMTKRASLARLAATREIMPRRGVALVVVLWTVALLATAAAMASSAARTSAAVASNTRAQITARVMAESGVLAATTFIDDSLRALGNRAEARDDFLSRLESQAVNALPFMQDTLADGIFAVTVVDVSARLDVNTAGVEGLSTLFATVTTPGVARALATRIDAAVRGERMAITEDERARMQRDSLADRLLGRAATTHVRRPFESLDAVRDVAGDDGDVLDQVAEFLTVDGDSRINRRAAPRQVLASATGSLIDAPGRLLLIARGWKMGHPLSRQLEAVYDVSENGLRLVRWRERDL